MKGKSLALVVILLLSGLRFPVYAQRPIIITIGQPNIWSLEQAHYLLSRMRAENLQLSNRRPTQDDLDPNAANGTRIQTLKMLLDISAALDMPLGRTNKLISTDKQFNQQRRQDLLTRMDTLYSDLDRVTGELAVLKVQREKMNSDGSDDATKKAKDAEVEAATAKQDVTKARLTATSDELKGLTSTSGDLKGPTLSGSSSSLPDSIVDKLLKDGANLDDPRLSASTILDNHIQLQYEMVAKQLTLLRDEVGPGERLVFLELPASFYTTPGRAEEKVAQVWWQINGFRMIDDYERRMLEIRDLRRDWQALFDGNQLTRLQWLDTQSKLDRAAREVRDRELQENQQSMQRILQGGARQMPIPNPPPCAAPCPVPTPFPTGNHGETYVPMESVDQYWRHAIRTIDLIPRQSSLNVNDIQDTLKAGKLSAAFSFLFGFGAKVDFQRQRELYEQYLHQEIYASGFGKGERTFGWTYGPTPGTKRIAPGLRTSYAILIVPERASALRLTAKGCYFPRKAYAPDRFGQTITPDWTQGFEQRCTGDNSQVFDVPIPGTRENNFWLTEIRYKQVPPGQRTAVFLHGDNISAQTGVLINGTPLRRSVGVAQPELDRLNLDDEGPDSANVLSGYYELINPTQMVLVFKPPKEFKGTPVITLVAPGRGRIINNIPLRINQAAQLQTLDDAESMFAENAPQAVLSISDLDILTIKPNGTGHLITAQLTGSLFKTGDTITINGRSPTKAPKAIGTGLYELEFELRPEDQTLNVTIVQGDDVARKSFAKPITLEVRKIDVLNFVPATKKNPGSLTIQLHGVGFQDNLQVSVNGVPVQKNEFIVVSPTEAVLTVKSPPETMVVTLTNPATGVSTAILVVRPKQRNTDSDNEVEP